VELWITAARFDADVAQSRMNIALGKIATFREDPAETAAAPRFCGHPDAFVSRHLICGAA
jgi:hypothetical protein